MIIIIIMMMMMMKKIIIKSIFISSSFDWSRGHLFPSFPMSLQFQEPQRGTCISIFYMLHIYNNATSALLKFFMVTKTDRGEAH